MSCGPNARQVDQTLEERDIGEGRIESPHNTSTRTPPFTLMHKKKLLHEVWERTQSRTVSAKDLSFVERWILQKGIRQGALEKLGR